MAILKNAGDISEAENVRTTMTLGEQFSLKLRVFEKGPNSTCPAPQKGDLVSYGTQTTFFAEAAVLYADPEVTLDMTIEVERGDLTTAAIVTLEVDAQDIVDRAVINGEVSSFAWSAFSQDLGKPQLIASGVVTVLDNGSVL